MIKNLFLINRFNLKNIRSVNYFYSTFNKNQDSVDDIYADIEKRVSKYRTQLKRHIQASLKHRQLKSQINNLNEAMSALELRKNENLSNEPVPSRISLEILSSGTGSIEPSVLLRTPTRGYLINCPETTSRMLPSFSLRANNINDILITSCNIRRIGGISGFMLSQCTGVAATRIHGPQFIKNYLEFLRPFADAEFGEVKYPGTVIQQPYDSGSYEDITFKISYIPLIELSTNLITKSRNDMFSIAYLIETQPGQRKIDMFKIMKKKVPKGPLIGVLKSGKPVTLDDGTVIKPEDVYADEETDEIKDSSVLIVDAITPNQIKSLLNATLLQPFIRKEKILNYIVHFTLPEIFNTEIYQKFSKLFDNSTTQIICNGSGKPDPHLESVYKHQIGHNALNEKFYPKLWPDFDGIINENSEFIKDENGRIYARPMQRYILRGPQVNRIEECSIDLRLEMNPGYQRVITTNIKEKLDKELEKIPPSVEQEPHPKIIFLGTSSAVPSKYRNVTSVMIQTQSYYYMIDSGEGTFGQMKNLFGDRIDDVLKKLNVIFLTHTHQDHINGLVTVLQERNRACQNIKENEEKPKQLVVVCNRNILKNLHTFSHRFYNVLDYAKFVVPIIYANKLLVPADITKSLEQMNLLSSMPDLDVKAVKVNHTSDAVGYIMTSKEKNRKIVISGDTTPCDFLIEHGKGAHVLIHEATFEDEYEKDALYKKHSTMLQAVNVGKKMEAKHTILTHFSARYPKVSALPDYLDENGISIAMDNLVVSMEDLDKLPKLNDAYRILYEEELFEILKRTQQRGLKLMEPPAKKIALGE